MHIMGDRVMLAAIVISAITSVALGFNFVESALGLGVSAVLMVVAVIAYASAAGALASRLVLAFVQSAFVACSHSARTGRPSCASVCSSRWHCCWCTWTGARRVISPWSSRCTMCCSTLQAAAGVYCLTEASFARTLGHAVYVVIQTSLEVLMAVSLGRTARGAGCESRGRGGWRQHHLAWSPSRPCRRAGKPGLAKRPAAHGSRCGGCHRQNWKASPGLAQIASGNNDLSARTEQQASALEEPPRRWKNSAPPCAKNADNARTGRPSRP